MREKQLVKNGSVVRAAQTSYQRQQQIAMAEASAAQTELQLAQERYHVNITAPIDGAISGREITIGQSVADPGAKLMTITDERQVLVTANIYERDLGRVKIGQKVAVKVPGAATKSFSGQISLASAPQ